MARHHYHEAKFLRRGERLRDFVFGYNDGAVTTLAVIVTLTFAGVDNAVIILGAMANIFGAGLAFTLGDYISVKSQMNFIKSYSFNKKMSRHEKEEVKDLTRQFDQPVKIALIAFGAFIISGGLAVSPFFVLEGINALMVSLTMIFISVFSVGLYRAQYTHGNMFRSGMEMVVIAALALAAAYIVGTLIGTHALPFIGVI